MITIMHKLKAQGSAMNFFAQGEDDLDWLDNQYGLYLSDSSLV